MGRNVVVDMRIRVGASCAFLAVLGGTLSACSLGDDGAAPLPEGSAAADTAASSPAAVDPWTLPIEDRPELFNPCTEISLEDLAAAGLENPNPWPEAELEQDSPPIKQCGWEIKDFTYIVAAQWTDLNSLEAQDTEETITRKDQNGFESTLISSLPSSPWDSCSVAVKTNRGVVTFDVTSTSTELFMSDSSPDTCAMTEEISGKLIERIEGALR